MRWESTGQKRGMIYPVSCSKLMVGPGLAVAGCMGEGGL